MKWPNTRLNDAQRELVRMHVGLPQTFARKFAGCYRPLSMEDMEAEATMGLVHAAAKFVFNEDRSNVVAFPGYAWVVMRSFVRDARKYARRRKRYGNYFTESAGFDEPAIQPADPALDRETAAILRGILESVIDGRLRPNQREIVRAHIDGRTIRSVAAQFGCTHQYVSKLFRSVRQACRMIAARRNLEIDDV